MHLSIIDKHQNRRQHKFKHQNRHSTSPSTSPSSPSNSGSKNILLSFIPVFVFPILFCVVLSYVYCECKLQNAARANLPRRGPETRTYAVPTTEVAQNKLIHHYYMNSMWTLFNEACLRFYPSRRRAPPPQQILLGYV